MEKQGSAISKSRKMVFHWMTIVIHDNINRGKRIIARKISFPNQSWLGSKNQVPRFNAAAHISFCNVLINMSFGGSGCLIGLNLKKSLMPIYHFFMDLLAILSFTYSTSNYHPVLNSTDILNCGANDNIRICILITEFIFNCMPEKYSVATFPTFNKNVTKCYDSTAWPWYGQWLFHIAKGLGLLLHFHPAVYILRVS